MINFLKPHQQRTFMRKHIFLLVSVGVLTFMALTTEKKILVTTGYAVTEEEMALGHAIYQNSCHTCHEYGRNGAPSVRNRQAWDERLANGIDRLLQGGVHECLSGQQGKAQTDDDPSFSSEEMAAAIAFMIKRSRQ
jgi:cytochrome c5